MIDNPLVTVLLPVYNGQEYIIEAADSILQQDYRNFELLLINDGSKDDTDRLIRQKLLDDPRVRYVSRENKGLVATLNEGIAMAKGEYIARMDADDIAHTTRLSKQVKFLRQNPDVALVGSAYNVVNQKGELTGKRRPPCRHSLIKPMFMFGSPMAHPSVMLNKKLALADLYYDSRYIHAEDYELWLRLSLKYKLANISDICLDYRVLPQSISRRYTNEQQQSVVKAQLEHLYYSEHESSMSKHAAVLLGFQSANVIRKTKAFCYAIRLLKVQFSVLIAFGYLVRHAFRK